jgi:hypothetical protein
MSAFDLVMESGTVLLPLVVLSLIAWAIIFERYLVMRRIRREMKDLVPKLRSMARRRDGAMVVRYCAQRRTEVTALLRAGIERWSEGSEHVRAAVLRAGRTEELRLLRPVVPLLIVGGLLPVTGGVGSFFFLATSPSFPDGGLADVPVLSVLPFILGCLLGVPAWVAGLALGMSARTLAHEMETMCSESLHSLMRGGNGETGTGGEVSEPVAVHDDEDEFFRKKR